MILMPGCRSRHGSGFLARGRRAFPGELEPPATAKAGVARRVGQISEPVIEESGRGVRLQQRQDRNDKRLDVPHHMTVIIMIIMPSRESRKSKSTRAIRHGWSW